MKFYQRKEHGKIFRYNSKLFQHQMMLNGKSPSNIRKVAKLLSSAMTVLSMRQTILERGPYEHNECGKGLSPNTALTQNQRIHTTEMPCNCNKWGGKVFLRSGAFLQHQRLRTGDKLYKCRELWKALGNRSLFIVHRRIHTGKEPFQCKECGKAFSQNSLYSPSESLHQRERLMNVKGMEKLSNGIEVWCSIRICIM